MAAIARIESQDIKIVLTIDIDTAVVLRSVSGLAPSVCKLVRGFWPGLPADAQSLLSVVNAALQDPLKALGR